MRFLCKSNAGETLEGKVTLMIIGLKRYNDRFVSKLWFATSIPADTIVPSPIGLWSVLHADEIELAKIGRTQSLFL
jgi:hypothetical protein